MKKHFIRVAVIFLCFFASCKKKGKDDARCFTPPSPFYFGLHDAKDNDLLDTSNAKSLKIKNIELSYQKDPYRDSLDISLEKDSFDNDRVTHFYLMSRELPWKSADGKKEFYLFINKELKASFTVDVNQVVDKVGDAYCSYFEYSKQPWENLVIEN